ncbi:HAD family hydrolase [Streptomyces ipomoeae]|uniref:HAD family hydrolase n=1 Tax=Streptomyces ipomoeae TaxID=103232 RepID=UPI00114642E3|nr:HAD-IA family hydrolase [Streptomyces ipomoeae]MDX2938361.1 HAD-IA family hydrolase [Streptomyces ipomoeae]TQE22065.1 HAD family hydrolase [Streptomyces ipomoeae]
MVTTQTQDDRERTAFPVAAVIFDFDGVIVDSIRPDLLACSDLYREYGDGGLPVEWWAREVCGRPDSYERLFDRLLTTHKGARHLDRAGLRRRLDELWNAYFTEEHVRLMPGVRETLTRLHAAGLPLAIASASPRRWVERWLRHYGLTRWFTTVVTGDDVTARKPDPAAYLEALRRLGVAAESSVAFEDSLSGIAAARAAGVTVVGVPTPTTRFLDHSTAHVVLDDLSAVSPEWLAEVRRTTC